MGKEVLLLSLLLILGISFAVTFNPCTDGTAYSQCSNVTGNYGKRCSGAATGSSIPQLQIDTTCQCPNGWANDNISGCVQLVGCQNNNPACTSTQLCNTTSGQCQTKPGCQYHNPDCDSDHECINNTCVLKPGCVYRNPDCEEGWECNENANTCKEIEGWCVTDSNCTGAGQKCEGNYCTDIFGLGTGAGSQGGSTGSEDGGTDGWEEEGDATKPACCCPGLLIILAGAALFVMRK